MGKKLILILSIILVITNLNITTPASSSSIATTSGSNTLYVGGTGPNNYTGYQAIRNALNDANDGDAIFIYNGIYGETISINKEITIMGENKSKTHLIYPITIKSDNVTITNIKKTRFVTYHQSQTAILIKANNTKILNNIISNYTGGAANYGKGIEIAEGCHNNIISNNIFWNNTAAAVILHKNSNNNIITNNEISKTYTTGIVIGDNSYDNHISENTITYTRNGRGISLNGRATGNIIENNIIQEHEAGIEVYSKGGNIIRKNLIRDNNIGIKVRSSYNNIYENNDFIDNKKCVSISKGGNDDLLMTLFCQKKNTWKHNYWNESKTFPHIIIGDVHYHQLRPIKFIVAIDWQPASKQNYDF